MQPYGYCFDWNLYIVFLRAATNIVIGSSYLLILYFFANLLKEWERKRYVRILSLYFSFVFLVGLGHFVRAWNIWNNDYWAEIFVAVLASIVAARTAYELERKLPSMIKTIRDRAQKELWLNTFVEECPAPVAMVDTNLNYLFNSKTWCSQFGLEAQDLTGQHHCTVLPTMPQHKKEAYKKAIVEGVSISQEEDIFYRLDGRKEYISWKIQPVFNCDRTVAGLLLLCELVTSRKEREQEILHKNQELQAFAYTASHDLRSPIRTVARFADLLNDSHRDKLDDEGKQALEYIVAATTTIDELLNALLEWSRVSTKNSRFTICNLNEILASTIKSMTADIEAKQGIIGSQQLPEVLGDAAQIGQVFANLIANSLKFASLEIPPVIGVRCEDVGNFWMVSFSDNGIGFDSKHYGEKIFMPFQRLVRDAEYPGRGIGLAIVAKIIARHDGKIWAESQTWKGATFCFTLPKLKTENATAIASQDSFG